MIFGPTFGDEVIAAGLGGLPFSWSTNGKITGRERLTAAQNATLDAVIAAHVAASKPIPFIPLPLIQARMEAETVAAADGWSTYVNYIFSGTARRNAFLKIMFIGQSLRQDHSGIRATMTGAGFTAAQVDRVLAPPPDTGNGG